MVHPSPGHAASPPPRLGAGSGEFGGRFQSVSAEPAAAALPRAAAIHSPRRAALTRWARNNGIFLAMAGLCLAALLGMFIAGLAATNAERADHGLAALGPLAYLTAGPFWSALLENWESEFLQMAAYIVLTIWLVQRGSSESKTPGERAPQDIDPRVALRQARRAHSAGNAASPAGALPEPAYLPEPADLPEPVRRGGLRLWLYENSLVLLFGGLFIGAFISHALTGWQSARDQALAHAVSPPDFGSFFGSGAFWFQSMQNWQSEFMVMAVLALATVYLRQRGSPESKPVAAPHHAPG